MKSERVIAYIDGFNLYFGLREKCWRCYYWLDIKSLCQNLLKPPQHLIVAKYFTSRITRASPNKRERQTTYLEALNSIAGVKLYYGKYQWNPIKCKECGHEAEIPEEKMTDVQLGVEMVADAYKGNYDTALLVTGDIDLVPSVEKVRAEYPKKRVVVAFPPMRATDELRGASNAHIHISETILKKSLLPEEITKIGGYILKRPSKWQ